MATLVSPNGRTYSVPDEAMRSLKTAGWRQPGGEEVPNDLWTVKRLRHYATLHNIDLSGAKVKADVLKAINTAR